MSELVAEVLSGDPLFPPAVTGDAGERRSAIASFEKQTGVVLPRDVRYVMTELPGLVVASRFFDSHEHTAKAVSTEAQPFDATMLARHTELLTTLWQSNAHSDACERWMKQLVPVLPSGEEIFALDYLYNAQAPPLVGIDLENPDYGRFVAPSLLDFLRNDIAPLGVDASQPNDEPTGAAKDWSDWFKNTVVLAH